MLLSLIRGSLIPQPPLYVSVPLALLLAVIAYFNFALAPKVRATEWFGTVREPQFGLYGLCIANISLAIISFISLLLNRYLKLISIVALVLIALTAYAWYAGM